MLKSHEERVYAWGYSEVNTIGNHSELIFLSGGIAINLYAVGKYFAKI